jgi:hypothetical protein
MAELFEMPGTVRQANHYGGPCNLLGALVRETKTQYVYHRAHGPDAFLSKRLVHLAPCPCCRDHPCSRFAYLAARL